MTPFLRWWTDKETDERKVLLWNAMQNREKLLALLREAYEAGQKSLPRVTPSARNAMNSSSAGTSTITSNREK